MTRIIVIMIISIVNKVGLWQSSLAWNSECQSTIYMLLGPVWSVTISLVTSLFVLFLSHLLWSCCFSSELNGVQLDWLTFIIYLRWLGKDWRTFSCSQAVVFSRTSLFLNLSPVYGPECHGRYWFMKMSHVLYFNLTCHLYQSWSMETERDHCEGNEHGLLLLFLICVCIKTNRSIVNML